MLKIRKGDEMKKKAGAAILLIIGILMGCSLEEELEIYTVEPQPYTEESTIISSAEESKAELETETQPEIEQESKTIQQRVVIDGKMQSYLTGEWKEEEVAKRRSMAVMMPNDKAGLPQYGISKASIIYEAPVEGRDSRLMAFFEDYDELEYVGPVRSSRDYYIYEAMPYDAIYCNWGLARPFVEELINSNRIDNVSQSLEGIYNPAEEAYDRISRPGYAKEFTGYLFIDGYQKAVKRLGYETEYRDTFVQAFTFANDNYPAEYKEKETAVKIYPGGTSSNSSGYGISKPCFSYNEEDGLYYRSQFGNAHKDEMNGKQLAVSNVVFKICHGEVREPKSKDYLAFEVHGEGEAYVFTAGKVIHGTWKRNSDNEPNLFFDEDGNEIIFNQGKTWICNIWKEYQEFLSYE